MNGRRSNIRIIGDILKVGEGGAGKTEIEMMSSVNMSYSQIQKYLGFLVGRGFIDKLTAEDPPTTYLVTEKGLCLLNTIRNSTVLADVYDESVSKQPEMPGASGLCTESESKLIPAERQSTNKEILDKDNNLPLVEKSSVLDKAANGIELTLDKLGDALVFPVEKIARMITILHSTIKQHTR